VVVQEAHSSIQEQTYVFRVSHYVDVSVVEVVGTQAGSEGAGKFEQSEESALRFTVRAEVM
jgi:hypothetical protein